jgi:hypothetical protein
MRQYLNQIYGNSNLDTINRQLVKSRESGNKDLTVLADNALDHIHELSTSRKTKTLAGEKSKSIISATGNKLKMVSAATENTDRDHGHKLSTSVKLKSTTGQKRKLTSNPKNPRGSNAYLKAYKACKN